MQWTREEKLEALVHTSVRAPTPSSQPFPAPAFVDRSSSLRLCARQETDVHDALPAADQVKPAERARGPLARRLARRGRARAAQGRPVGRRRQPGVRRQAGASPVCTAEGWSRRANADWLLDLTCSLLQIDTAAIAANAPIEDREADAIVAGPDGECVCRCCPCLTQSTKLTRSDPSSARASSLSTSASLFNALSQRCFRGG